MWLIFNSIYMGWCVQWNKRRNKKCQKLNQTNENDLTPQLFNYDGFFFFVEKSDALESEF